MLRTLVAIGGWLFLGIAVIGVAFEPSAWPMLLMAALIVAGTAYERVHYRGGDLAATGGRWTETPECFHDEESGRIVTVWYNPVTGERRYVEAGEAPPR